MVNRSGLSAIPSTCTQCGAPRERPRLYNMLLEKRRQGGETAEEPERLDKTVVGCGWKARGTNVIDDIKTPISVSVISDLKG